MKTTHIVIGVGAILAIGAAWLLTNTKSTNSSGTSNKPLPSGSGESSSVSIEQPEMIGGKIVVKAPIEDTELLRRIKENLKAQYEASGQSVSVLTLSVQALKEFNRIKSGK